MKRYEVVISDKADEDMKAICQYIAETLLEPVVAAKKYDRIAEAILSLGEMPERIRLMDSKEERSKGLRPLLVDKYTVFFVIKDDIVHIVRVLYSTSDISKRLFEE